ncbi:MAG: aquaporin [Deltaproteobacteria bacterium]|nr:aquaporin [Deltaproteobacteria bacterium]
MEAAGLGLFMLSACVFGTLFGHPASPLARAIGRPFVLRAFMGVAMGGTALALVLSPWGKRSGAHLNPSFTLTFYRLGKIVGWDAGFYVLAQFLGGIAGVAVAGLVLARALAHPAVRYVVTTGAYGSGVAFAAEFVISFGLMLAVLVLSNVPALNRFTPLAVAALVAAYITLEAPLSGMSMNPARSFASALPANFWEALWIYFVAPPLGMLAAAECYLRLGAAPQVLCAKLHHANAARCIFHCEYPS